MKELLQEHGRYVGGICGNEVGNSVVTESCNLSSVTSTYGVVGGICGGGNVNSNILYCFNIGNITGNGDDSTGYTSAGGIAGIGSIIKYCYNRGAIYGALGQCGGISGNCYNMGNNIIMYCYNTGTISGKNKCGSIVGECYNSSINDCYWTSSNSGRGYRGSETNCRQMSDVELKAYTNTYFINDNSSEVNNGYPILYWQKST